MFVVKWIARFKESSPIITEGNASADLDAVVSSCKERLEAMRARHAAAGLQGFIVCDEQGAELRRWMEAGSADPLP